ncbi:MAG: hypothetical protein ACI8RA_001796 [Chlamydiales bacterium]|jgi:hypothetical protein
MAKIDFSKVEKAMDIHAKKMFIEKIINMTEKEKKAKDEEEKAIKNKHMGNVLHGLKKDLDRLSEKSEAMWEALGITRDEVTKFIENPGKLSKEDRDTIKILMKKVKEYKNSTGKAIEEEINDDIVQAERARHEDLHINLNAKWKPI